MVEPGLVIAGVGIGVKCIELLASIIKTAEDAHHLKDECQKVQTAAELLKSVLERNKDVLDDMTAAPSLVQTLEKLLEFVTVCKEKNIFQRSWEIAWTKSLPGLLKDMLLWISLLNVEVSV
jgi:hypothetical protein